MIGELISRIREDRGMKKKDLAREANINIGHLTHIEKEERNPSHKTLKLLCDALKVPYQPIMKTYDIDLTEEQKRYKACDHIKYDSIPVFENLKTFSKLPRVFYNVSYALKVPDSSMSPKINEDEYVFIEENAPLSSKNMGLFEIDGKYVIRKFIIRRNDEVIRAEDSSIDEIVLDENSKYNIIGKIVGKADAKFKNITIF